MDAQQTISAIEAGIVQIQEAKEASKLSRIAKTPANAAKDVFEPNTFEEIRGSVKKFYLRSKDGHFLTKPIFSSNL